MLSCAMLSALQPKPRDGITPGSRPPVIPAGVAEARARRAAGEKKKTERDLQEENGGAGAGQGKGAGHEGIQGWEEKWDGGRRGRTEVGGRGGPAGGGGGIRCAEERAGLGGAQGARRVRQGK